MRKTPSHILAKIINLSLIIGVIMYALYFYSIHTAHYKGNEGIRVDIPSGASVSKIADILKEKSLINSTTLFKIHARLANTDRTVKAGRYLFEPNLTPSEILMFLSAPTSGELSITIPEGYTIFEIDEKLTNTGLINEGDFIQKTLTATPDLRSKFDFLPANKSLEGFLFPDTYLIFAQGFTSEELVEKMLTNFKKRIIDTGILTNDLYEKVIMASILEKEVRTNEDLPTVSGLLWKRIASEWPLQVDASVLYERELAAKSAQVSRKLSSADLREDSPYNTYTRLGLPPAPIGNPGLATLKAAANPIESEFWFYLTDEAGNVHYGRTNAEHEKNKTEYLR